jgi:AcrR family transcriptional regulator
MSNHKKRVYVSQARDAQAAQTRRRILGVARRLFQAEGFECVAIERLAKEAGVSAPTIYGLFQSKRGVLLALMDDTLPQEEFEALVAAGAREKTGEKRLANSAKIARQMYDAERAQMDLFRGASVLAPEFKELEREREQRRFKRQEKTVLTMAEEGFLAKGLSVSKARDILWAFTGRDMYRMFVVERGWPSDEYEKWLAESLIQSLIN